MEIHRAASLRIVVPRTRGGPHPARRFGNGLHWIHHHLNRLFLKFALKRFDLDATQELAGALRKLTKLATSLLPKRVAEAVEREAAELRAVGSLTGAVGVGERFPDFKLNDQEGRPVALEKLLERGPAVVAFVRGGWCPRCNLQLRAMNRRLRELDLEGASLVAVTPEAPDQFMSFRNVSPLDFPVLYDSHNGLAHRLRIVWQFGATLRQVVEHYLLDLTAHNRDASLELPIPAVYVVGRDRRVAYAYLVADYQARLDL